jgi:predicted nuclease with TOPRIM domain
MAFKMTKAQLKERDGFSKGLNDAAEQVKEKVEAANAALAELRTAVEEYDAKLESAKEFVDAIATEAQDAYDEKSEKWQEGEKGDAVSSWIDELQSADIPDALEITIPEDIGEPTMDHADTLDGLSEEPT